MQQEETAGGTAQFDSRADHARVPLRRKVAYAFAGIGPNAINGMAFQYGRIFYNLNLGVSSFLVGNAYVVIQFIDALNDIILGQISDNTRTRWGRRRPYILFGGIACALFYPLIWAAPSGMSPWFLAIYLAVMVGIADTAFTLVGVPYAALGAELSYDYHERTRVMSFRTAGMTLGSIGGSGSFYLAAILSGTSDHQATQRGFLITVAILGVLALFSCLVTFLGTREEAAIQAQPKINFLEAFKYCFKNRNYLILIASSFVCFTGFMTGIPIENYICLLHVAKGNDKFAGQLYLISQVLAVAVVFLFGLPFLNWLSRKFGKKFGMGLCIAFVGLWIFTTIPMLTPSYPILRIIFVATYVWAIEGMLNVFVGSMTADLCDIDELMSGRRREGMYMALLPLIMKLGGAAGLFLWGVLVKWAGVAEGRAVQSPETIQRLFIGMIVPTFIGAMAGLLILLKYNVTEETVAEVRAALEQRRRNGGSYSATS